MRVAVVGAGIMGACTARELAERGHDVALFDQFKLGTERGSSHGRSRIIRKAYPDAFYTAIMDEAYGLWFELQEFADKRLVFEPGLLYFGSFHSETLRHVLAGLQEVGVPHEVVDHEQACRHFPQLKLQRGEIGIFTPEAGWVHAKRALEVLYSRFRSLGGVILEDHAADVERIAHDFDAYVLAPGAWITEFVNVPVSVSLQTFGYVAAGREVDGPVWIDDCPDLFYGFPSEPKTHTFKIGVHQPGPVFEANRSERPDTFPHKVAIKEEAMRRFGISGAIEYHTCLYTSTSDEDFLLGRHGEKGYFVSACSGHGFKFGPWVGRTMANFVEDKDAPENHPRFCWPEVRQEA